MDDAYSPTSVQVEPARARDAGDGVDTWSNSHQRVETAIFRLTAAIDEETAELQQNKIKSLQQFHERKSKGLLELNRAMKLVGDTPISDTLNQQLKLLRQKLVQNQSTLDRHLTAVKEISTIISNAIRESQSDGTYSVGVQIAKSSP